MKRFVLLLFLAFLLSSCAPTEYHVISEAPVDGYDIYEKEAKGLFCNTYYNAVFYSGETYNYGYRFKGCSPAMTHFILVGTEYVYLQDALDQGIITLDSLIPELDRLDRETEEMNSDEADYHWTDFHISGEVVYVYSGGECDQSGSESFVINGTTYYYEASGCLKDHILYLEEHGTYTPVADLIADGVIDPDLLIPLLTEQTD